MCCSTRSSRSFTRTRSIAGPHRLRLFLDHVPDLVEAVAGLVARLLVLDPQIERLALVGPLLPPVIARDDRVVAAWLVFRGCFQRRPDRGTLGVAHAPARARRVLVESVQRHARVV